LEIHRMSGRLAGIIVNVRQMAREDNTQAMPAMTPVQENSR
jgi:hypothetical protein